MNFIGYYRVSTEGQGQTGLGLDSQRSSVLQYINSVGGTLLNEFTDVESGTSSTRSGLNSAIELAATEGAVLVVKRLDRLTRDGFKTTTLLDEMGVQYIDCDSPQDNPLVKNIKLALAKDERDKISIRTKNALEQIQARIEREGHYTTRAGKKIKSLGHKQTLGGEKAQRNSAATRRKQALENPANRRAPAVIVKLRDNGESLRAIANFLNDGGFKTSKGNAFSQVQVKNLYERHLSVSGVCVGD